MANHWIDIGNSDCILIMGSNAAENHPISFTWVSEAMQKLIRPLMRMAGLMG
jgi:formate dehydrogenase major subunit